MTERTLTDILIEARDSLTEENWRKGSYFNVESQMLYMCAHGAVQKLVNPTVGKYLAEFNSEAAAGTARSTGLRGRTARRWAGRAAGQ